MHEISRKNKIWFLPFHKNQGFQKINDRNWDNGFFVTEQKQVRMHHCEVWQKKFKYFSATSSPDDDHLSDGLDQVQ